MQKLKPLGEHCNSAIGLGICKKNNNPVRLKIWKQQKKSLPTYPSTHFYHAIFWNIDSTNKNIGWTEFPTPLLDFSKEPRPKKLFATLQAD